MDRHSMQKLRLDRRLVERNGWISQQELASELDALPDVGHKATTLGDVEDDGQGPTSVPTEEIAEPSPTA